jgi:hypothetical protein
MSQRDEHWGDDEDVVRRLRDGKPRFSAFELDRIKTSVMSRVRPSGSRRAGSRFSLLVALLTVGAMAAGTAGTIAASNVSQSGGTGAAQSQYRPPKCNPRHEECTCPGGSIRHSRDRCVCPPDETFAAGTNDCFCPNGKKPDDNGKCRRHDGGGASGVPATTAVPKATPESSGATTSLTPASTVGSNASAGSSTAGSTATVGSTHAGTTHKRTRRTRHTRRSHSSRKIG